MNDLGSKITAFEIVPGRGGCFELTADGKLVYSKLATGEFPDPDLLADELESLG